MHVAAVTEIQSSLVPALVELRDALQDKVASFGNIIKIGRTHLQVRNPLVVGRNNRVFSVTLGRDAVDSRSRILGLCSAGNK